MMIATFILVLAFFLYTLQRDRRATAEIRRLEQEADADRMAGYLNNVSHRAAQSPMFTRGPRPAA